MLNKYKITFLIDGKPHKWERFGPDMETALSSVKKVIAKEFPSQTRSRLLIFSAPINCQRTKLTLLNMFAKVK